MERKCFGTLEIGDVIYAGRKNVFYALKIYKKNVKDGYIRLQYDKENTCLRYYIPINHSKANRLFIQMEAYYKDNNEVIKSGFYKFIKK